MRELFNFDSLGIKFLKQFFAFTNTSADYEKVICWSISKGKEFSACKK